MTGDCHVRFCERLRGETPLCLLGENKNPPRWVLGSVARNIFSKLGQLCTVIFRTIVKRIKKWKRN